MPSDRSRSYEADEYSFSEVLSPADGFFHSSLPQDAVFDPSNPLNKDRRDPATMTRGRRSSSSDVSRHRYSSSSRATSVRSTRSRLTIGTIQVESDNDNEDNDDHSSTDPPPPPAYEPGDVGRSYQAFSGSLESGSVAIRGAEAVADAYNTLQPHTIVISSSRVPFLNGRLPESMGYPENVESVGRLTVRGRAGRGLDRVKRSIVAAHRFCNLVLCAALAIVLCLSTFFFNDIVEHFKLSPTLRHHSNGPDTPEYSTAFPLPSIPSGCFSSLNTVNINLSFPLTESISLIETTFFPDVDNGEVLVHTSGEISLVPAPASQKDKAMLSLQIQSEPWSTPQIDRNDDESVVIRSVGHASGLAPSAHPCVRILGKLYINPSSTFSNVQIHTDHLSVGFSKNLTLNTTNSTAISSVIGSISRPADSEESESAHFNPNMLLLHTTMGSIRGTFPLCDILSLHTLNEAIFANVTECPAPPPSLPSLYASSKAGPVEIVYPPASILSFVRIETISSAITASFLPSLRSIITSISGQISASFTPKTSYGQITTRTTSSPQTVVVLRPALDDDVAVLGNLSATHTTIAGALDLQYPDEWEGHVRAETMVGQLKVDLEGLKIVDEWRGPGRWTIEGVRGTGAGWIRARSINGAVTLQGSTSAEPVMTMEDVLLDDEEEVLHGKK